jgi:hypothetical protein
LLGTLQVLLGLRFNGGDGGHEKQGEENGELKQLTAGRVNRLSSTFPLPLYQGSEGTDFRRQNICVCPLIQLRAVIVQAV